MITKHFGPVIARIKSNTLTIDVDWNKRRKQPLNDATRAQAVAWALSRLEGYEGKGYRINNKTGIEKV